MARSVVTSALVGVSLALFFPAACTRPDVPQEYESFFALPFNVQADSLRTYPPVDQIEIYLLSPRVSPPGHPGLAFVVAENGPPILPSILPKLAAAQGRDPDIEFLLLVLSSMVCEHGHSLSGDTTLARVASEAAARNPNILVERAMTEIRTDCRDG